MVSSFAHSQTSLHHDIAIAHTASWLGELTDEEAIPSEKKPMIDCIGEVVQRGSPSFRTWNDDFRTGMDSNVTVLAPRKEWIGKGELLRKATYGPATLDVAFLDNVDGNAWSGRFKQLLSFVDSSSSRLSILNDRRTPWVRYQVDYSDLWDTLVLFRGDLKGDNNHKDPARKLASANRDGSRSLEGRYDGIL
ncbi:hypothetical protein ARMSODRAFT_980034 [Armillaria solidipes]|uniref:Uncharacterized protein n=1 Tax=Armillaria solidipes TaxID=1076256 RepID=A0A2H3AXF6_9AGAR|nr:hypothetical protein ARMSODRAFT_980034 [Armillaria solidipes]